MRRRMLVAAGIVMIVLGGLLWNISRDRLNLAERATRINSVRGWGLDRPDIDLPLRIYNLMSGGAQYQWLNSRQILFFHDLKPIEVKTLGPNNPGVNFGWPASVGTPALYDAVQHREQPLPQLAALFRRSGGRAKYTFVSPDGASVLWRGEDGLYLADIDGSHSRQSDKDASLEAKWTADGKQLYTLAWNPDTRRNTIAIRFYDRQQMTYHAEHDFAQPLNYRLLGDGILQENGNLATNSFHLNGEQLMLYSATPEPFSAIHVAKPTLPKDAEVKGLVYSPRGDRLAWIVTRPTTSSLSFLQDWLARMRKTPQPCTALYVSGAMGENLHEVVHIPIQPKGRQFYLIDYVRWQPDEKTLSFVSEGNLYTVPSD